MESLLIFNISFTLSAYYGLLRCFRRFSNSFSILMMFSIDFENDVESYSNVSFYRRLAFENNITEWILLNV